MESPALGLYVAASLALIATPGQDMIYVVTRSLAQGRLAGAAYLVYLGIRLVLGRDGVGLATRQARRLSPLALVWQGMLSNVTNPKIVLFFFAFLPQFVDRASAHPTRDLVFLGVLYAVLALPVKAAVGFAAGSLADRVLRRPHALAWINRMSGAILVGLGLRLAAADHA